MWRSDASLNCVACYWTEALISEGNSSAACDVMQAAVARGITAAASAAAGDVTITHACALAVAGSHARRPLPFPAYLSHPCSHRAFFTRERGLKQGRGGGRVGLRSIVPCIHCAKVFIVVLSLSFADWILGREMKRLLYPYYGALQLLLFCV